ncbi:19217_t:CDS:1, partial [Gigaspora margarita]
QEFILNKSEYCGNATKLSVTGRVGTVNKKISIKIKHQWIEEGEKSTKYFFK